MDSREQRMQADLREFAAAFPQAAADPGSIPKEVWAEVRNGRSLTEAYARYHEAQAARNGGPRCDPAKRSQWGEEEGTELERKPRRRRGWSGGVSSDEAERQNAENEMRSTGTMRNVYGDLSGRDAFLQGFLE